MSEHQQLEYKQVWKDEYLKVLCGFANADGGKLVIGKNDRSEAVGVSNARKLMEDLPNKIRDVLGVMADVRLVKEGGKELVEVCVASYPSPISYKGEYHIRSGSTKQELKGAALDRFILRKYGRTWDSAPLPHVAVRDLSKPAMTLFKKLARQSQRLEPGLLRGSAATLIEKLNLIEGSYLKRAALLLFHPEPDRFFTGAFVKIGYFRGEVDLIYQDEVHGDLFTQTQKVMELLLTKYLKAAISYQGIQRIESFPVPREALREAILNALIHRDYANTAPIQIRVYDDRLCIWNPGVLPESWTIKKFLSQHSSCPFNPLVANAFFRAGEIEAWGRGVQRMVDACKSAGNPKPKITYEPSDLWVEFPFSPDYLQILSTPAEPAGMPEKGSVKSSVKSSVKILGLLRDNPAMTIPEMAETLGVSTRAVEKTIRKLQENESLRRVGPDKGGRWEVLK
jgi:ATP-dependent DNA helicase RecG